jgi:lipoprotein-anchoring transpeptidase ErfK/SrfK
MMRRLAFLFLFAAGYLASAMAADAAVLVRIDKSSQRMTVAIDGRPAFSWPVSTGRGGFGTPTGRFRPQWLARLWFSTKYYGSPMPHSIFFHKGYAIHGTNYISRLGGVASHGCVRLHPAAAATLFGLVQRHGFGNTSIVITGANPGGHMKRRARSVHSAY